MSRKSFAIVPTLAAAGIALGLAAAPAALAEDPCNVAVSSSRCLGPEGVEAPSAPAPNPGPQNGPYGSWGSVPPLG